MRPRRSARRGTEPCWQHRCSSGITGMREQKQHGKRLEVSPPRFLRRLSPVQFHLVLGLATQGPRPSAIQPRRPHTTQSQSRSLGDTNTSNMLGSTMNSNLGSTMGSMGEAQPSPRKSASPANGRGGVRKSSAQQGPYGRGGARSTGGRDAGYFKQRMKLLLKGAGGPIARALGAQGRQSQAGAELPSLAARAEAIEAKCSPEVREAFRCKPPERCGCATIQAVWSACDTFWEFDHAHSGAITREAYINLMRECATVNTLRMLRRARLEFRFRRSAAPVHLEEFLLMLWPKAMEEDRLRMMRWAELRECFDIVSHNFGASDQDLEKLFRLLGSRSNEGKVVASDLSRSSVLPGDVVAGFAKERHPKEVLFDSEEFKSIVWPKLKERWMNQETMKKQKTVEEKEPLRVRIQRQTESDHAG
ncbi:unnamed protein product [Effrenium voratum]|nr:unnamed protein product [Effrenium voratum]